MKKKEIFRSNKKIERERVNNRECIKKTRIEELQLFFKRLNDHKLFLSRRKTTENRGGKNWGIRWRWKENNKRNRKN